jgi:hypothetical protein
MRAPTKAANDAARCWTTDCSDISCARSWGAGSRELSACSGALRTVPDDMNTA